MSSSARGGIVYVTLAPPDQTSAGTSRSREPGDILIWEAVGPTEVVSPPYDNAQGRKVLAPEYGGDGKSAGRYAAAAIPVIGFPGHWGPDGLLFYWGTLFPERYRGGAFIAFHGLWNRAPMPQAGYKVVFVPRGGSGFGPAYETFADGFAGGNLDPGGAVHRPVGLAQAPDGSLYITDDQRGGSCG